VKRLIVLAEVDEVICSYFEFECSIVIRIEDEQLKIIIYNYGPRRLTAMLGIV
jgi:hypothetical protein